MARTDDLMYLMFTAQKLLISAWDASHFGDQPVLLPYEPDRQRACEIADHLRHAIIEMEIESRRDRKSQPISDSSSDDWDEIEARLTKLAKELREVWAAHVQTADENDDYVEDFYWRADLIADDARNLLEHFEEIEQQFLRQEGSDAELALSSNEVQPASDPEVAHVQN